MGTPAPRRLRHFPLPAGVALGYRGASDTGALLVVDEDRPYDPTTDTPVLITTPRAQEVARRAVLLNGRLEPPPVELRVGVRHRLRLINITTTHPGIRVEVLRETALVQWRAVAKDGADLPDHARVTLPARQLISIGETYDFEITPREAGAMRLQIRTSLNVVIATMPLVRGYRDDAACREVKRRQCMASGARAHALSNTEAPASAISSRSRLR